MQPVSNSAHGVLTHTISDVGASVCTQAGAGGLEIRAVLDLGQVAARQIRAAAHEVGDNGRDSSQHDFAELPARLRGVCGLVDRQRFLPVRGEFAGDTASELSVLVRVFLAVGGQERGPFGLEGCTSGTDGGIGIVRLLGHGELGFRVKSELGLESDDIVRLESWCNVYNESTT